jgi:hypothetical protein
MRWTLSGPGSAVWTWEVAGERIVVHASYLTDGLASLLRSAGDLSGGSRSTFTLFAQEPGGNRVFFSGAAEEVFVQVVAFPDVYSTAARWAGGRQTWAGRVSTAGFLTDVRAMAEDLLARHGDQGYRETWGHPFPHDELRRIAPPGGPGASLRE